MNPLHMLEALTLLIAGILLTINVTLIITLKKIFKDEYKP